MPLSLSNRASRDLDDIYNYGLDRWGLEQADRYLDDFWRAASFIEAYPRAARPRVEIAEGIRAHRFGTHLIVYEIDDAGVHVLRVAHGRSDWINDPV